MTAHQQVLRARSDLWQVREAADRQRRTSARLRRRAAVDRAEASGRTASFIPDAYGPRLRAEFMDLTRRAVRLAAPPGGRRSGAPLCARMPSRLRRGRRDDRARWCVHRADRDRSGGGTARRVPDRHRSGPGVRSVGIAGAGARRLVRGLAGPRRSSRPSRGSRGLAYGLSVPTRRHLASAGDAHVLRRHRTRIRPEVVDLGSVIAAYLAVAAGLDATAPTSVGDEAALHRTLSSRDVIGQAKGILIEGTPAHSRRPSLRHPAAHFATPQPPPPGSRSPARGDGRSPPVTMPAPR